jgi:predicted HAD superfamily phosphohydrolase YqeG
MSLNFIPDFRFERFSEATVEFLSKQGIKGLLLDIDNTLEPYENPKPGEDVLRWFEALGAAGIKCAFVSNNGWNRVEEFNKELGFVAFAKASVPTINALKSNQ